LLYRRIEERLLLRIVHVGLGDQVRAGVDVCRHLLALRRGERCLHAVIAHSIGILQKQRGDRAVLEIPDKLVVGVEADEFDRIALLLFSATAWLAPWHWMR